jgi:Ca-activated chloride channel family protein
VKDENGQVVKSKLDENRLRRIAQETGGIYLHLENGPRTMKQLINEGLSKMKAAEMDVRSSRQPIERYEWPLGLAILALTAGVLVAERKRARARLRIPQLARATAPAAAALLLIYSHSAQAAVPGVDLYNSGKFSDAYQSFDQDLRSHPNSGARDRIQFDAGTAAYKMRDYDKALQSFSNALLSRDPALQERSHYNIGRTLEERADMAKSDDIALNELEDAQSHYEDALTIDPKDEAAKNNLEEVRKKIERLKNKKPSPTPPPQSQQQQKNKNQQNDKSQQNQSQNQQSQQNQEQQSQNQNQSSAQNQNSQEQNQQQQSQSQNQQNNQQRSQQFAKNQPQKNQPQPGESPSPSEGKQNDENQKSSGEQQPNQPPTPSGGENESPSPSPGQGEQGEPSATPGGTPRKPGGELKAAPDQESNGQPANAAQAASSESPRPGEMTPREAEELLRSMKDEEARVRLDERRSRRTVYKDW